MSRDYTGNRLLLVVCVVTIFFAIMTPPFQAPDENQHYMKALALSQGHVVTQIQGDRIGAELPRAAVELHALDFRLNRTANATAMTRR